MTTASTSLALKRSIEACYTSGSDDGTPGQHPGHTPYMNNDDWAPGMIMGKPSWMTSKCYPAISSWPKAEAYFNTRYVWAHAEFTPQQTMRGKMALYGYLYGISSVADTITQVTEVSVNPTNAILVWPNPAYFGEINVDLTGFKENVNISIYDFQGKLVFNEVNKGTEKKKLLIPDLLPGMFIIKITGKNKYVFEKVIIQ